MDEENKDETTEETTEEPAEVEMNTGTLEIDLQGTKIETEEKKGWLTRIFSGKEKTTEVEDVTQLQYLEKIYAVFKELGYENVLSLSVNERIVYEDEENTDKDFETALKAAIECEIKKAYHIEISLDTTSDGEENIFINMFGKHEEGEIPLIIEVEEPKKLSEVKEMLENMKNKINEKFGIESGTIYVDEEDE